MVGVKARFNRRNPRGSLFWGIDHIVERSAKNSAEPRTLLHQRRCGIVLAYILRGRLSLLLRFALLVRVLLISWRARATAGRFATTSYISRQLSLVFKTRGLGTAEDCG